LGPRHIQNPTVELSTFARRAVPSSRAHGWVVHPGQTTSVHFHGHNSNIIQTLFIYYMFV
jgi:hypothetical protein